MRFASIFFAVSIAPNIAVAQSKYERQNSFLWDHRGTEFHRIGGRITRVFARPFGRGAAPRDTAARFCQDYAEMFGVLPADLVAGNPHDRRLTQPVMYDAETGTYRHTMVYYRQYCGGIPVYKAEIRLLVANREGYPLVWANPYLRDVGDYDPASAGEVLPEQVLRETCRAMVSELTNFTRPRLVVFAGVDNEVAEPRLAVEITGDNLDRERGPDARKRTFVLDAVTGEVLHTRSGILNFFPDGISGTVSGWAAPQHYATECILGGLALRPLPYARVEVVDGNWTYADANGDFVIPDLGKEPPVTVRADLRGNWFEVTTGLGMLVVEEEIEVEGGAVIDFALNPTPASEFPTAQVNAYIQANEARDRVLAANPMFPAIRSQLGFELRTNTGRPCGSANWRGSFLRFTPSDGSECVNRAFGDVVHHEYGHHLVAASGSFHLAYGEGMGDVMGLLATGSPEHALGWNGDCTEGTRSADNTCQYDPENCSECLSDPDCPECGGEVHRCGTVLSGSVWHTRVKMENQGVSDFENIVRDLAINAMLLHTGSTIDPSIYIDWLILDDDNANLLDGTPHDEQIKWGFDKHSMAMAVPDVTGEIYTWTDDAPSDQNWSSACNWELPTSPSCTAGYPDQAGDAAFIDGMTSGAIELVDETIRKLAVSRDVTFTGTGGPTLSVKGFTLFAPDTDIEITISGATISQPPAP